MATFLLRKLVLYTKVTEQVGVEVALYTCTREVLGLNLDQNYTDLGFLLFSIVPPPRSKFWDSTSTVPWAFPSKSIPVHLWFYCSTLGNQLYWFCRRRGTTSLRSEFNPRLVPVGCMVDSVAAGQVFSEFYSFPCQFSPHQILHFSHLLFEASTITRPVLCSWCSFH
jgi:hypothetical protein